MKYTIISTKTKSKSPKIDSITMESIQVIGMVNGLVLFFYWIWCLVSLIKQPISLKSSESDENSFFVIVTGEFVM